jgi:hypothetical protein
MAFTLSRVDAIYSAPFAPPALALVITLLPTAWRFGKASRIRLAIAGADADHYAQVPHGRPPAFTICLACPSKRRSIASVPDKA